MKGSSLGRRIRRDQRREGTGGVRDVEVTLIDQRNHHLFQPPSIGGDGRPGPADIAAPIRAMLSRYSNIRVLLGRWSPSTSTETVTADIRTFPFDYLILACGATHSYFGHDNWEEFAPGLKTLEQATEIRRRVLTAFENAERAIDPEERRKYLTFVIVGGGPTGVELAGAIGEMSRFTLAKDFRSIDAKLTKVILVEAGPRILPTFSEPQAMQATRDLEGLGVEVRTSCSVTWIDAEGIQTAGERLRAGTVLWAAGVKASPLAKAAGLE
jgi:NADH dehydrogenase